jgi:hypothetical protein
MSALDPIFYYMAVSLFSTRPFTSCFSGKKNQLNKAFNLIFQAAKAISRVEETGIDSHGT